jgi:hypothetical protein
MEARPTISPYAALEKRAKKRPPLDAFDVAAMQRRSADYIAALAATLFGAGVVGRTGLGALRMVQPQASHASYSSGPPKVRLYAPPKKQDEEEEELKLAGVMDQLKSMGGKAVDTAANFNPLEQLSNLVYPLTKYHAGQPRSRWEIPATLGVGLPLGVAALAGGYGVTDVLLDKMRKREQNAELEKVKQEYQELVEQAFAKRGSDENVTDAFDKLANARVGQLKEAQDPQPLPENKVWWPELSMPLLTAYLGFAGLTGLGAGKFGYDWARKRSDQKLLERALKERQRRSLGDVPPVYVEIDQEQHY